MNNPTAAPASAQTNDNPAFEFVKSLAAELSAGAIDLPSFPEVAQRVNRALDDPRNSVEQTARIVGAEPALAARLLNLANSAAFTYTGKPLTELRSAITRLGSNLVRSTALSFAMAQMRHNASLKSVAEPLSALWAESIHVAAVCYGIARRTKIVADEAFLAGLLHGIGKLYILVRAAGHPDLFRNTVALEDIARDWHTAIGKAILENWDFPEKMADAIANQDDRERKHYGDPDLTDVLVCASVMAACAGDPQALAIGMKDVDAFRLLSLDCEQCAAVLKHAELQIGALRAALGE